ncbi:hypothetical protein [Glaciimonas sp. PCH181]|uniref:hypothetical protein n=1 Tax=Glaciimonas sp. PCH181 TaxID=2133943 RepID=UPI000D39C5AA|nr:hypothetical protein [Glaciimonas sp. PCH181]PUA19625.1 hypothetical protein C7W93_07205 [Glaciimonas sp. PCH181]
MSDALNDACLRAVRILPDEYSIEIMLEGGFGIVKLRLPNGKQIEFPPDESLLTSPVENAIAHAIKHNTEQDAK